MIKRKFDTSVSKYELIFDRIVLQIEEAGHFLFVFDVYQRPLEEVPSVSERVLITLTTRALVGAPGELVSGDGRTLNLKKQIDL